jgi:plastocyanin
MRKHLVILVSTAILIGAGVAATAALATTGPSPYTTVTVKILEGKLVLNKLAVSHVTFVDFFVTNAGKVPHNFTIGGFSTHVLKPGQKQHLYVGFPVSGKYAYKSTLHATAKMAGIFHISEPEQPDGSVGSASSPRRSPPRS